MSSFWQSGTLAAAALLVGFVSTTPSLADTGQNTDPAQVKIVTSDIARFWSAFDLAAKSRDPALVYGVHYFAPGTPGLWAFVPNRLVSPQHLTATVAQYKDYYLAARPHMAQIPNQRKNIIADLQRYKAVYPTVTLPNIYFVVGRLNSGGTSNDRVGLILGAEILSRPPDLRVAMPGFNTNVLTQTDKIPALIAHELTHFNQHDADQNDLLEASIYEGTADFMAQLVDGHNVVEPQWQFGCAHEDALWSLFQTQMSAHDDKVVNGWLFSYDSGPMQAPPFIGYWLGSRIVQTYYDAQPDKQAAVNDIMHITDFKAFLAGSGYPQRRSPCAPETRAAG